MGCWGSKAGSGRDLNGSGNTGNKPETIFPDPDLGWRRIDGTRMVGLTTTGFPQGTMTPPMYPLPECWNVLFVSREGNTYLVSLVVLALNIAIRAATLARRFHISELQTIGTVPTSTPDGSGIPENDHTRIYRSLDVPNYKWRLIQRAFDISPKKQTGWFRGHHGPGSRAPRGQQHHASPDQFVDLMSQRQRLQQKNNSQVIGDVAEIAMNIAEQLFRLESHQTQRHPLPNGTFGWTILNQSDGFRIAVASPEGDAYFLVPEELIMNVTSWVQQTYLTSHTLNGFG